MNTELKEDEEQEDENIGLKFFGILSIKNGSRDQRVWSRSEENYTLAKGSSCNRSSMKDAEPRFRRVESMVRKKKADI